VRREHVCVLVGPGLLEEVGGGKGGGGEGE